MTANRKRLLAAVFAAAAALGAGAFWLLGTAGGARFLIAAAARRAAFRIEVGRVSGRLAGELRLGAIDVRWPTGEAAIDTIVLRWRPLALLRGTVSIAALLLDGAAVDLRPQEREEAPAPRFEPRWPTVTGLPARLEARIATLRLSDVAIRRPGSEPAVISEATAQVGWKNGVVSVSGLSVKALAGTITGSLSAGFVRPALRAELDFHDVDLVPFAGARTELSGSFNGEGSPNRYAGDFSLRNRGDGLRNVRLSGAFAGDLRGIAVSRIQGRWLDGNVRGEAKASWSDGFAVAGSLAGRSLNPARIRRDWPGRINFEVKGSATRAGESPVTAEIDGRLLSSSLRHRPLTGELRARIAADGFRIARLSLHGDGFDVMAKGRLRERLTLSADIRRVGGILPGAEGSARAEGWIRWRDDALEGSLSANARKLHVERLQLDSFAISARRTEKNGPFAIRAEGRGVSRGPVRIGFLSLEAAGTLPVHTTRLLVRFASGEADASARGGYRAGAWEGTVTRLSIREKEAGEWKLAAPFSLAASSGKVKVSPFQIAGPEGARFGASADLATGPLLGSIRAEWKALDLSLLSAGLPDARIAGSSGGTFSARWRPDGRLEISGDAALSGSFARGELNIDVPRARAAIAGNERGIRVSVTAALEGGGSVTGTFISDRPARTGIPEGGKVRISFESVDLALASPWFPEGVHADGAVYGRAEGEWLPEGRLALDGAARIASGKLRWEAKGGEVAAALRSADLRWRWTGDTASGEIALVLEEYGEVRGSFRIPLPARLPPAMRTDGNVEGAITAKLREKGLISAFLPGMVQESSAEIALALTVGGTWGSPAVNGTAALTRAEAHFPAAGIRLAEITLRAEIAGREIHVATLAARSGGGSIEGRATVRFEKWSIAGYDGTLKGKEFLALDLPEVRLVASPDLSFEGTTSRLKVRGEIGVPEMQIRGRQAPPPVPRSEDVVIVDAKKSSREAPPLSLDVSVKVVLGKHVLVKAQGVDARLEGAFTLLTGEKGRMIARGEVRVAQGSYAVKGIRLTISRGGLLFAGSPVEEPTLDFLAIRTVGEVKAGVEVAGTLKRPVVKLYSEPSMQDTDILAYIVLGHPLGQQKEQAEPLMLAASALLPYGQSAMLQDRLRRRFGLDVIEVKTKGGETAGSVVTIGKYLNPRLFVSYGRSVFTGTEEFTVRYDFRKRWQIETQFGEESGADLFYKIEFR